MTASGGVELRRHDAPAAASMLDQLADLYDEVRAEAPYNSAGPIWTRQAFLDRTRTQLADPGFVLVTAQADKQLVGFAFGLPMAPGRWFSGDTSPPADILAASKFAVIELNVARPWRRQGIGRALLDSLLADRSEQYAMLGTLIEAPARRVYERWGWRSVAASQPNTGIPPMETLVLPLTARRASS